MTAPNPYFDKEWLMDGRVLCYRYYDMGREAAEVWYHDLRAVFAAHDISGPLHLLFDARAIRLGTLISPHGLTRARQISEEFPTVPGRTASLIGMTVTAQVVSAMLRTSLKRGLRDRSVFSDEAAAIAWLLQYRPAAPPDAGRASR